MLLASGTRNFGLLLSWAKSAAALEPRARYFRGFTVIEETLKPREKRAVMPNAAALFAHDK